MSKKMYVRTYIWGNEPSAPRKIWRVGVAKYAFIVFLSLIFLAFGFIESLFLAIFPKTKQQPKKVDPPGINRHTHTHKKTYLKHILNCYKKDVTKTQYTFRRRKLKNTPDDESDITFFIRIMSHMNTSYFGDINEQGVHILPLPLSLCIYAEYVYSLDIYTCIRYCIVYYMTLLFIVFIFLSPFPFPFRLRVVLCYAKDAELNGFFFPAQPLLLRV